MDIEAANRDDEARLVAHLAFESDPANHIKVGGGLVSPHRLTLHVQKQLQKSKVDDYGAVRCVDATLPYVRVPPGSVGRALLVLDALLKVFDARGFTLVEGKGTGWDTSLRVSVEGQALEFSIEESARRQMYKPTEQEKAETKRRGYARYPVYEYVPSGVLAIKNGSYGPVWKDLSSRKLEDRLNDAISGLLKVAFRRRQDRRESEERERLRQAEAARRAALRTRREAEEKAVAKLEADGGRWVRARDLRAYLAALETSDTTFSTSEARASWLAWAKGYADWLDPLSKSPKSILDLQPPDFRDLQFWEFDDLPEEPLSSDVGGKTRPDGES